MADMAANGGIDAGASAPSIAEGSMAGPGSDTPMLVPAWLANLAALGWRVIAVAALLVVLWLLAGLLWTVTASIAIAIVISALFAPFVLRLRAGGRSRSVAAAIVWVTAILVSVGVIVLLLLAFLPYLTSVVAQVQSAVTALQSALAELQLPPWVVDAFRAIVDALQGGAEGAAASLASAAVAWGTVAILACFLVFFFLRDGDKAWLWTFQALSDQKLERITDAGETALARVGGYLRGTTILSALIALTDLVFMLVLGVPLAVPLSVLVFFSGYIPYFGGIVTTMLILLVTYGALGTGPVIVMLVLIAIRNSILGYAVRPAVYGRTVSIHPALVLLALPAGYQLAGVIGLFAAVPVTAVVLAVASATIAIVTPDPRPQLPGLVPAWLDRVAQWSWRLLVGIAMIALIVGVFMAIPMVLIPVVVAIILVATLEPVARWLMKRGRTRAQAAAISVGGGFLVVTTMLLLAVAILVQEAAGMGQAAIAGAESASTAADGQLGLLVNAVTTLGRDGVQTVIAIGQDVASAALIVLLSTLLAFYFLRDGRRLWQAAVTHTSPQAAPRLQEAGNRAFEVLGGYMFGTAAISFVGAASQLVIMVVLGIPLALPIFVLSFFLCFIPYIGGFISTGAALLVTIAFGSPAAVGVMIVWTLVFNIVTGNIVSPLVYGRTVHLHPAVVLVAIPAGSAIAGVLGMFLVVPAIGVVAATWRTVVEVMGTRDTLDGSMVPPEPSPGPRPAAPDAEPEALDPGPAADPGT